jgi:hypothetical protein
MLANQITITGAYFDESPINYNRVSFLPNGGVFSNPTAPLDEPEVLSIRHELSKDGKRRSSAFQLKKLHADGDEVSYGVNDHLYKIVTDTAIVSKAQVTQQAARLLVALLASIDGNVTSMDDSAVTGVTMPQLLNGEG